MAPYEQGRRVAVVTGASAGIGRAIAAALTARGMMAVNADLTPPSPDRAETARETAELPFLEVDVGDERSTLKCVEDVLTRFGRLDVLVNNAGVAGAAGWELEPHPRLVDWKAVYQVNLLGVLNMMAAARPAMLTGGGGRVVNIASISGRQGRPVFRHYAASKAAVIQLSRAFAADFAADGISVNVICPGLVWTPMWERVGAAFARADDDYAGLSASDVYARMVHKRVPLLRGQTAESIADAVTFFACSSGVSLTGQTLNVDGGIFLD